MRIAFLSRYQDTLQRGAENFVAELSKRLSQEFKVDILSGNAADNISGVINGKYNVVIPINGRFQSLKASLGRLVGDYKLLISGHSGIGRDDLWNIVVAKPDVFVALTEYMANWAKKFAWGSQVIKIPNGIDLDKFTPVGPKINFDLKRPIILSVGALAWYKHHDRVMRELGEGSVLIVGEGPEKENLKELGKKYLGSRFKIANFSYEDMPRVYRSVDLFTLPSWNREAFGIVYLEAMASGLGVVAPDDPPRREIVGEGGILVETEDPKKYAKAIESALKIDWQKRARSQAEKFSWDKIAKQYAEVLGGLG